MIIHSQPRIIGDMEIDRPEIKAAIDKATRTFHGTAVVKILLEAFADKVSAAGLMLQNYIAAGIYREANSIENPGIDQWHAEGESFVIGVLTQNTRRFEFACGELDIPDDHWQWNRHPDGSHVMEDIPGLPINSQMPEALAAGKITTHIAPYGALVYCNNNDFHRRGILDGNDKRVVIRALVKPL